MIIERNNYLKITYENQQEKDVIENIIKRYCIHKNPKKEETNNKKYFFNIPSVLKTYNVKKIHFMYIEEIKKFMILYYQLLLTKK